MYKHVEEIADQDEIDSIFSKLCPGEDMSDDEHLFKVIVDSNIIGYSITSLDNTEVFDKDFCRKKEESI